MPSKQRTTLIFTEVLCLFLSLGDVARAFSTQRTLYEILGAPPTATRQELHNNYRILAKKTHPDAIKTAKTNVKKDEFAEISQAWSVLSDPQDRMKYDLSLRASEFNVLFERELVDKFEQENFSAKNGKAFFIDPPIPHNQARNDPFYRDASRDRFMRDEFQNNRQESPRSPSTQEHFKESILNVAEELVCAITKQLPLDPVIADDGCLYERDAIEEYIEDNIRNLRSPVTDEPMRDHLLPSNQAKNTIRVLIDSGAVPESICGAWRKKLEVENFVDSQIERAEDGDVEAMKTLADYYYFGKKPVEIDYAEAYKWCKRAADLGDATALAGVATHYAKGMGVEQNALLAIAAITEGISLGSSAATCNAGLWFYYGRHGFPKDTRKGLYFLRKIVEGSCTIDDLSEKYREIALEIVRGGGVN
mmetsp:Transcript_49081/g.72910  ORF Transcript_49081/g.72910 Transcript_49081/m.72910 type:complete len:420 (+) Transcript_49081:118-1377(+)|eukprot:CAMPEP_0195517074 /NCGR_PEP_ID=MMETSP0794_2-20130614/9552_1 /TAXON_ID=515487 /ORGANISM="Stephanopyxis turris, Strain CCMP 815" /LENGTH=419 /DNA_ID=CAMNT_0040645819 /DNA_START=107 /DNA_END=1366 /DNA_ORIENTATION=+